MQNEFAVRNRWMLVLLTLSLLSFLAAAYLFKSYHLDIEAGRPILKLCDLSDTVSCEKVNLSPYSKILNTPLSLLGMIWLLGLIALIWVTMRRKRSTFDIFIYSSVGLIFTLYYLYLSWATLKAVCIPCHMIHLTVVVSMIVSLLLLDQRLSFYFSKGLFSHLSSKVLTAVGILMLIAVFWFNLRTPYQDYRALSSDTKPPMISSSVSTERIDRLAQCLAAKGVRFYGSSTCQPCKANKALFGLSFGNIHSIECDPAYASREQIALCKERKITHTPTWTLEKDGRELGRRQGLQSLEQLARFAGCSF